MFFSPFIALRYLKPKRTFVSIITLISVMGVALGVWVFTVVIAVFSGYGEKIKENILGFEPHLEIRPGGYIEDFVPLLTTLEEMDEVVSATPYVLGSVIMEYKGMRQAPIIRAILPPEGDEAKRYAAKLATRKNPKYDPETAPNEPQNLPAGEFQIDPYTVIVGDAMADALGMDIGSTILLYSPKDMEAIMDAIDKIEKGDEKTRKEATELLKETTLPQEVTVAGIFDSGNYEIDSNFMFLHLEIGQTLYNFEPEEAHGIAIRTDDAFKVNHYKDNLLVNLGMGDRRKTDISPAASASRSAFTPTTLLLLLVPVIVICALIYFFARRKLTLTAIVLGSLVALALIFKWGSAFIYASKNQFFVEQTGGKPYQLLTWMQINKTIFDAIATERQAMYLILFIIMIVGGFCIMNTMITVTFQKRSEIGLMKALGAREDQIAWLFVFQGMIVGIIGVVVGLVVGQITLINRNRIADYIGNTFGVDLFSAEVYKVDGGLPAVQTWQDLTLISLLSFVACTIAALIPAIIAANLQPAKALRSE